MVNNGNGFNVNNGNGNGNGYGTWLFQERPEAHDANIASVSPIYLRTVSGDQNLQACPLQGLIIL